MSQLQSNENEALAWNSCLPVGNQTRDHFAKRAMPKKKKIPVINIIGTIIRQIFCEICGCSPAFSSRRGGTKNIATWGQVRWFALPPATLLWRVVLMSYVNIGPRKIVFQPNCEVQAFSPSTRLSHRVLNCSRMLENSLVFFFLKSYYFLKWSGFSLMEQKNW